MKRDHRSIEDLLRQSRPPEVPQMAAVLGRVLNRLRADRGETDAPTVEWEGARRTRSFRPVFAAAAVVVAAAVWAGMSLRSHGVYAVLEAADGTLYRLSGSDRDVVSAGDRLRLNERLQTNGGAGAQLILADGSRVEMRSQSELFLERATDGMKIRLVGGGVIVNAAKQRDGHLYVQTNDMTVAVVGTVFFVNAGDDGSRVAVIEGEVRVQDGKVETKLRPGEQMSSRQAPAVQARPVIEEIAWSRQKDAYLAVLQSAVAPAQVRPITEEIEWSRQASTPSAASGQAAGTEFEEASIRLCDLDNLSPTGARGGGPNTFRMTPGRTYGTCLTLATLIRTAYGSGLIDGPILPGKDRGPDGLARFSQIGEMNLRTLGLAVEDGRRVRGGPDWVRSELYTIDAAAPGPADAQTMRGPMLRALLERRFGLRVHVETEQLPAFKLTVAPGGLKMKEGTCTRSETPLALEPMAAAVRRNLDAARRGATTAGRCNFMGALNGPNLLAVGAGQGVRPLGEILARLLDVAVLDQTGIPDSARFNYVLELVPDDSLDRKALEWIQAGDEVQQIASDPSAVPRAPGIFTALEEQLGLRLERARAPREFIVIDRVERLSPN